MPKLSHLSATLALLVASHGAQAITVQLDYSFDTSNFFTTNANSKAALEAAAQYFAANISDSLSAITSAGGNHFNAVFNNPTTGAEVTLSDYSIAADTLVVYVGANSALPSNTLGEGGPGGFTAQATSQAFLDLIGNRGQAGVTTGAAATDFAPWGGTLSINSTAPWYFDAAPSTVENFAGQNDFYSVALHELGHLFGIGTADSWTGKITGGSFTGANAEAANGGNPVVLANTGHWLDGTQSVVAGNAQEAAMDPSLTVGSRKYFTALDAAALKDIGWQVAAPAPVPLPAAGWLFLSSMLGVFCLRRKSA